MSGFDPRYKPVASVPSSVVLRSLEPSVEMLQRTRNIDEVGGAFADFARRHGLKMMGQLLQHKHGSNAWNADAVGFAVDEFNSEYMRRQIYAIDPALRCAMRANLPIPFGMSHQRHGASAIERQFYAFHDEMNNPHGLGVPIHGPNFTSLLGVTDDGAESDFASRLPTFAPTLHLFGVFVAETLLRFRSCDPAPKSPSLTRREIDCLSWAAEGMSAWEIADILNIAESSVVFHHKNARRKLNAKTLTQAVAKAMQTGLLPFG